MTSDADKPLYENDLIGSAVETRLWRILADSGYNVIHFFKEQVDELQQLIRTWDGNQSVQRVRSAPDLYVTIADADVAKGERVDLARKETHFVEVTFRNTMSAESVSLEKTKAERLARQLAYWRDTILVIFIPKEPFWYARELTVLETKIREAAQNNKPVEFNLLTEFRPITEFFSRTKPEKLLGWTKPLLRLIECLRPSE